MWTDTVKLNGNEPWKFFQLEVCNHSMSVPIVRQAVAENGKCVYESSN